MKRPFKTIQQKTHIPEKDLVSRINKTLLELDNKKIHTKVKWTRDWTDASPKKIYNSKVNTRKKIPSHSHQRHENKANTWNSTMHSSKWLNCKNYLQHQSLPRIWSNQNSYIEGKGHEIMGLLQTSISEIVNSPGAIHRRLGKMWDNHVIIKRNKVLIHETIGMTHKILTLSKRSLTKKHAYRTIPFTIWPEPNLW